MAQHSCPSPQRMGAERFRGALSTHSSVETARAPPPPECVCINKEKKNLSTCAATRAQRVGKRQGGGREGGRRKGGMKEEGREEERDRDRDRCGACVVRCTCMRVGGWSGGGG